jgi:uncharacterized repeat protein (TIGR02543 family)
MYLKSRKAAVVILVSLMTFIFISCDFNPLKCTVKVMGGEEVVSETEEAAGSEYSLPENPDKDLELIGWAVNGDRDNLKQPGDVITIEGDTVVEAVWYVSAAAFDSIKPVWSMIETVTITAGDDVTIRYTTDGSDPTYSHGEIGRKIHLNELLGEVTVKAVSIKGNAVSDILTLNITVVEPPEAPVLTGADGVLEQTSRITVNEVEGTTVRYTLDGTMPTMETGKAGTEISLAGLVGPRVLTVVRFDANGIASEAVVKNITVKPSRPSADISDGEIKLQSEKVTLTAQTGSRILYTLDDTNPLSSETVKEGKEIKLRTVSGNVKLRAVAVAGDTASEELVVTFSVKPSAVQFSVKEDEVIEQNRVVTAKAAEGAVIYYTLDGTDPKSSATKQSGNQISVSGLAGKVELKAYAEADGIVSDVVTRTFKVKPIMPDVSTVTEGGKYLKTHKVTGITGQAGTTLRYTLDGSIPSGTSEIVPEDGIPLTAARSGEVAVKVAAEKDGVVSAPADVMINVYDYRLIYDLDGGTDKNGTTAEVWYNRGDSVAMPGDNGITKEGWTLDGWYTKKNGQGTYYALNSTPTINLSSDLTLYAHWLDEKVFYKYYSDYCTAQARGVSVEGDVYISATCIGRPVKLAEGAFKNCLYIEALEFDADTTIAVIPNEAFAGSKVKKVINMPTVTSIGDRAFAYCTTTSSFFKTEGGYSVIPTGITLGSAVFEGATIEAVEIKEGLTELSAYTFQNAKVKKIKLPQSIKTIGEYVFAGSTVEEVNLKCVETVKAGAFNDCDSLKSVNLTNAVTLEDKTFYSCGSLVSVSIGNAITSIGSDTFENCTGLTISIDKKATDVFTGSSEAPWGAYLTTVKWAE